MLPYLKKSKIEIRPFVPPSNPTRASLIDHHRHWRRSAMVGRASVSARDKGGALRPCGVILIFCQHWPILLVVVVVRVLQTSKSRAKLNLAQEYHEGRANR